MHDGHEHNPTPEPAYGPYLSDGPTPIANYGYMPTTVTVRDGSWFSPAVWSNGVPGPQSVVEVKHHVTIAPTTESGDLNGDGKLDVSDYLLCKTLEDYKRFGDDYFGLAQPGNFGSVVESCLITQAGCLSVHEGSYLSVGTVQVLGCFELFGGDIIFRDLPIDTVKDAMQWGHGLIVHSGGSCVTRGGKVSSENPAGVRGHFAILHSGTADLEGTEFADLGRTRIGPLDNTQMNPDGITAKHVGTNQMARYGGPHFHHCWGPAGLPADVPQFRIVNCYIHDGTKWGVTIHQSHYGVVQGNRIERCGGAGIAGEDGPEWGNLIADNIVSDIFGDGLGEQGHNAGRNVEDIGDGTAANPYRTTGSHGNHGVGFWFRGASNNVLRNKAIRCPIGFSEWARFNENRKRPTAKGQTPAEYIPCEPGGQEGHAFEGNIAESCPIAYAMQGMTGTFLAKNCSATKARDVLDASYSGTLRFDGGSYHGTKTAFTKLGFTGAIELINLHVDSPQGAQLNDSGFIRDCKFTGSAGREYEKVNDLQQTIIFDNVEANPLYYRLGDYFNKRSYTIPETVLLLNHGPDRQNYQLWLAQQAPDYVMPNTDSNRGRRQSPEPGLTNQQLWDKYRLALAGRVMPADAFRLPGVDAWVTPVPADLTPPQFTTVAIEPGVTSAVIRVTTDEPTWACLEYNDGEIKVEGYEEMQPATKELATEHTLTIEGLKPATKYSVLVRLTDESGNAGGDMKVNGLKYDARLFTTRAK